MTRILLSMLLFLASIQIGYSQQTNLLIRLNNSFGFEYHPIGFYNQTIDYTFGGGMGLEVGAEHFLSEKVQTYGTIGYQLMFSGTFGTGNQSSMFFNRKFATLGANYLFPINKTYVKGILIGGGINANIPGKLEIVENDVSIGDIHYKFGLGYHVDAKIRFQVSEKLLFEAGLRYRNLHLDFDSFDNQNNIILPSYLSRINNSGLELQGSLICRLGKNE